MVKKVAVDILLGTSFIRRFIRGTFSVKREAIQWYSYLVTVLSGKKNCRDKHTIEKSEEQPTTITQQAADDEKHGLVQKAR